MKKRTVVGCLVTLSLLLSSCGTTKLYNWVHYEDISYAYSKKHSPEAEAKLAETYQMLIDSQNVGRKTVPPGICAEYGFLLVKQGKKDQGIALLEKEIALYPESEKFIGRIIKQLQK